MEIAIEYMGEHIYKVVDVPGVIPISVLQEIRQEIDSHGIIMQISNGEKIIGENVYIAKEIVLEIIDNHISGKEQA